MAKFAFLGNNQYEVSDDGQVITDPLGNRIAVQALSPGNPLGMAARDAAPGTRPAGSVTPSVTEMPQIDMQSNPQAIQPAEADPALAPPSSYDPSTIIGYTGGTAGGAGGRSQTKRTTRQEPAAGEDAAYKAYIEAGRKATEQQVEAINNQAEIEKTKVAKMGEIAEVERATAARSAQLNSAVDIELDSANKRYQSAVVEASRIKPRDFWADKSTGAKILAGISVGLGAASQAMGGGQNPGLEMLKMAMNEDLEKQRMGAELARDRVVNARSALGMASQLGEDKITRYQAAQGLASNVIRAQIAQLTQGAVSEEMKAKGQQLLADWDQQVAEMEAKRQQGLRATVETSVSQSGGGAGRQGTPMTLGEWYGTGVPWAKVIQDPDRMKLILRDENVVAHDPQSATILRENIKSTNEAERDINALQAYYAKGDRLSPDERQSANVLWGSMFGKVKGPAFVNAGAAMSPQEEAVVMSMTGTKPTEKSWRAMWERSEAILGTLGKIVKSNRDNTTKIYSTPIYGRPGFEDRQVTPGKQAGAGSSGYEVIPH